MEYQLNITTDNVSGTSFHGVTIKTSISQITSVFGEPIYRNLDINDKVQYEWTFKDSNDNLVTLYDWKEYRHLDSVEEIEWHIGAHSLMPCLLAKDFLTLKLNLNEKLD